MENQHTVHSYNSLSDDKSPLLRGVLLTGDAFDEALRGKRKLKTEKTTLVTAEFLENTGIDIYEHKEHFELLLAILKKPRTKRSEEEKKFVKEALTGVNFFEKIEKQIGEEQTMRLINQLTVTTIPAGKTIFEAGDWGEEFYIILKGKVYILLEKKPDEEESESKPQESPHGERRPSARDSKNSALEVKATKSGFEGGTATESSMRAAYIKKEALFNENDSEDEQIQKLEENYPGFFVSKVLKEGDSFGEIALQNHIRSALLVDAFERIDQENLQILQQNFIFAHFPSHQLHNIYLQLTKKTYPRGHIFYKEGQKARSLFFVRSGEIEITKLLDTAQAQKFKQDLHLQGVKKPFEHKLLRKVVKEIKPIRLETLVESNLFGFEELLSHQPRSKTATVISSSALIFEISYERLLHAVDGKEMLARMAKVAATKNARANEVMLQKFKQELEAAEKTSDLSMKEFRNFLKNVGSTPTLGYNTPQPSPTLSFLDSSSYLTPVKQPTSGKLAFGFNSITEAYEPTPTAEKSLLPSPSSKSLINSPKFGFFASPKGLSPIGSFGERAHFEKHLDLTVGQDLSPSKFGSPRHQRIKTLSYFEQQEKINQERKQAFFHNGDGITKQTESKITVARHFSEAFPSGSLLSGIKEEREASKPEDRMKKDYNYDGLNLMPFLAPKQSVWAAQKANLGRRFQQEKQANNTPTSSQLRSQSFANKSERERYKDLCKVLRLKEILPSKHQDVLELAENYKKRNNTLNPELCSIVSDFRKITNITIEEESGNNNIPRKLSPRTKLPQLQEKQAPVRPVQRKHRSSKSTIEEPIIEPLSPKVQRLSIRNRFKNKK